MRAILRALLFWFFVISITTLAHADDQDLINEGRERAEAIIEKSLQEGRPLIAIQKAQVGYEAMLHVLLRQSEERDVVVRGVGTFIGYRDALDRLAKEGYWSRTRYYDFIGDVDSRLGI